jgi:hypothetical protein
MPPACELGGLLGAENLEIHGISSRRDVGDEEPSRYSSVYSNSERLEKAVGLGTERPGGDTVAEDGRRVRRPVGDRGSLGEGDLVFPASKLEQDLA